MNARILTWKATLCTVIRLEATSSLRTMWCKKDRVYVLHVLHSQFTSMGCISNLYWALFNFSWPSRTRATPKRWNNERESFPCIIHFVFIESFRCRVHLPLFGLGIRNRTYRCRVRRKRLNRLQIQRPAIFQQNYKFKREILWMEDSTIPSNIGVCLSAEGPCICWPFDRILLCSRRR